MSALAQIPAPPVQDLTVGPLTLHLYGLLLGIGIVLAMSVCERLLRRDGVDTERLMRVLLPSVVFGFVGGRLYHVLSEPVRYANHPGDIIKVWEGGLGIWGAIALGTVVAMVLAPRNAIPRMALLDAAAPAVIFAQAIGRWGNYVNQELFGRPTDLPWGLAVDSEFRPESYAGETYFHPTFLYESISNASIGVLLLVLALRWRGRPRGVLFALYVGLYSTVRFFVEGLRIDAAHSFGPFRQNEWLALTLSVGGYVIAAWLVLRSRRATATG